jgi:S-DNA-T family DNA segregation ATPase FtsK/SpoIIIE
VTAVAVVLVIWYGRPAEGKRIIQPAIVPAQYVAPTPDVILFALGNLGIPLLTKAVKEGTISPFIVGRDGPGWGARITLPHGVTATDVMTKREALSSALRRPLSAVWPAKGDEHEGDLDLWIGFQDLGKATPPPWPLLKAGQANVFDSIPFGATPRAKSVSVPMFEINWLIGAAPGQGKTAAVRVLASGVALDPLCDLWVHELANKGDLEPFARISHRYVSGNDPETMEYAAESVQLLKAEYARRSAAFKQVPKEQRPEGKLTRELARHKKFRPLVVIFDEVQNLFTDETYGKQAAADLGYVIRLGRALGIIIILSTQRPDANMIPTAVTGNILGRFCLMVPGQPENDMVLGTSSYRRGYDATTFRIGLDRGLGWLKGGDEGVPRRSRSLSYSCQALSSRSKSLSLHKG